MSIKSIHFKIQRLHISKSSKKSSRQWLSSADLGLMCSLADEWDSFIKKLNINGICIKKIKGLDGIELGFHCKQSKRKASLWSYCILCYKSGFQLVAKLHLEMKCLKQVEIFLLISSPKQNLNRGKSLEKRFSTAKSMLSL